MPADSLLRARRPGLSLREILTATGVLVLAGCASQPTPGPAASSSVPTTTAHPSTVPANAPEPTKETDTTPSPDADVVERGYVPHEWPDPSRDLWAAIRDDFTLEPNSERRSVRAWTQFYATHTAHLNASLSRAQPFL